MMNAISGSITLIVTKLDEKEEVLVIPGTQFVLKEGGNWSRDPKNKLFADFVFIASAEGFDLRLSMTIHGNKVKNFFLEVIKHDLKKFGMLNVDISDDELVIDDLVPPEE